MLQDSLILWKILSIIFFWVLWLFLLYGFLERFLKKLEFKKRLRLVRDELLFDIFKENNVTELSDFLALDEFSDLENESKLNLVDLKKTILSNFSKDDLEDLQQEIKKEVIDKNSKLNKLILQKYRDAIKSLNHKMTYLKNDLDVIKDIFKEQSFSKNQTNLEPISNQVQLKYLMSDLEKSLFTKVDDKYREMQNKIDSFIVNHSNIKNKESVSEMKNLIDKLQEKNEIFMRENIDRVYDLLKEKEKSNEEKNNIIFDQKNSILELEKKIFEHSSFLENKMKDFSLDKEYLDNYMKSVKKQVNMQKSKNIIFTVSFFLLFVISLVMFILVLTRSPIIYTLY